MNGFELDNQRIEKAKLEALKAIVLELKFMNEQFTEMKGDLNYLTKLVKENE